jgi:hypothetical protein
MIIIIITIIIVIDVDVVVVTASWISSYKYSSPPPVS